MLNLNCTGWRKYHVPRVLQPKVLSIYVVQRRYLHLNKLLKVHLWNAKKYDMLTSKCKYRVMRNFLHHTRHGWIGLETQVKYATGIVWLSKYFNNTINNQLFCNSATLLQLYRMSKNTSSRVLWKQFHLSRSLHKLRPWLLNCL